MPKKKVKKKFRLAIKIILCLVYLAIIFILSLCAFKLFEKDQEIIKWKNVETTKQYSYIEISEMSEAFAEIKNENKQIHYVIEKEETGQWHTYLIAISKDDYNKYKKIIDYTYERTPEIPKTIKVYGYPKAITKNIKDLAIKNIKNFVPIENEVVLTDDNFEEYLTNTYLDTTLKQVHETNYIVVTLLVMALVLVVLVIFTILDKDKIVDEVDHIIEPTMELQKIDEKTIEKYNKKMNKTKPKKKTKKSTKKKNKKKKDEDIEVI